MGAKTSIEWTDGGSSWNPIRARNRETGNAGWFCVHESDGCRHCYSEAINHRLGTGIDYKAQNREKVELFLDEKILVEPLSWRRPRKIFVESMSDLFAEFVPDEWIDRIFAVMASSPFHTFQVLTKRPERMRAYLQRIEAGSFGASERYMSTNRYQAGVRARAAMPENNRLSEPDPPTPQVRHLYDLAPMPMRRGQIGGEYHWRQWPLSNVWLGVSVEDQPRADERIPLLLDTPAAIRWVSAEPLLGPIPVLYTSWGGKRLDWVVAGSESGPGARLCDRDWVRGIRDQCTAAGVAFFWKQHAIRGRKISTPELDGRRWVEYPAQERA